MNRGEVPGYEFEVPRGPRHASGPRHAIGHDPLRRLQGPAPEPPPAPSALVGVLAVMRKRNWLMGLAAPILAAVAVGIAVVVVTGGGGGGGAAPSALAAGFPPARPAGAAFTGNAAVTRVILNSIAATGGTEVAAGAADSGPALWASTDGGATWARAGLTGPASLTKAGVGQLAAVTHGPAGWLAVGTALAGRSGPLTVSSPDARTWNVAEGTARNAVASGVAAGPAGYVIVGRQSAAGTGPAVAAAWYAPGLTGWRSAMVTGTLATGAGQMMNAVTATKRGFVAVGSAGSQPAAWLSATGQTWQQAEVPLPPGTDRAALDYVAASGGNVVAAGTGFSAAGASRPFAEVSANAGATWSEVQLPVPDLGTGTGTTVTALTAAGGGFTAAGTYVTTAGPEVVIWTMPPGTPVTSAASWSMATPQGKGLASATAENAITGLAADGVTLTGVGFTASGTGAQQPTLWQSPIRY